LGVATNIFASRLHRTFVAVRVQRDLSTTTEICRHLKLIQPAICVGGKITNTICVSPSRY